MRKISYILLLLILIVVAVKMNLIIMGKKQRVEEKEI